MQKVQKFNIKIKANPMFPYYMQHRMDDTKLEEWEKKRGRVIEREDVNKEDFVRADFHTFQNGNGYFIPTTHVHGALINAGKFMKSKVGNSKKSMSNIVAGMFFVMGKGKNPEELPIKQDWEVDKRSAVNRNIKGRIVSIRPKWKDWDTEFELVVNNDTITKETIKELLTYAGDYVGIGSYRPEHNGQFGRFEIEEFEKI